MVFKFLWKWLGLTALLMALVFVPAGRVDAPMVWVSLGVYSVFLLAFGIVFSGEAIISRASVIARPIRRSP